MRFTKYVIGAGKLKSGCDGQKWRRSGGEVVKRCDEHTGDGLHCWIQCRNTRLPYMPIYTTFSQFNFNFLQRSSEIQVFFAIAHQRFLSSPAFRHSLLSGSSGSALSTFLDFARFCMRKVGHSGGAWDPAQCRPLE